mgnify:CR=1 FL=1
MLEVAGRPVADYVVRPEVDPRYPGVCVALAFAQPLTVPAGGRIGRRHEALLVDGELSRQQVVEMLG